MTVVLLLLGLLLAAAGLRRISRARDRRWRRQRIARGELFRPLPAPGRRRRW